jgi:hypothetical protein
MKGLSLGFKVEYSLFSDPKRRNICLHLGAKLIRFPWTVLLDVLHILLTSHTEFPKSHERTGLGVSNKIFPVLGYLPWAQRQPHKIPLDSPWTFYKFC